MLMVDTPLGNLHLLIAFEYFDFPVLFSCKNDTDQIYIANWIETNGEYDSWLFCAVSPRRHAEILKGAIDYYSIFRNSETGHLMIMRVDKNFNLHSFEWVESTAVADELLPDEGEFVDIDVEVRDIRDQLLPASEGVINRALEFRNTVGHIHFDERSSKDHAASTMLVGRGLIEFQGVLDAMGNTAAGVKTYRGSVSKSIKQDTYTRVTTFSPGSLSVEIVARDAPTLFDDSLTVDSFYKITQILAESENYQRLQAIMPTMGPRVAARYKKFLSTLKEFQADVRFEFSGASGIVAGASAITYEQALVAFENVSKIEKEVAEKISVVGILIGLERPTSRFTIRDADLKVYSGKFNESDGEFAAGAVIDAQYSAQLINMLEVDTISGKVVSKWILIGLDLIALPIK